MLFRVLSYDTCYIPEETDVICDTPEAAVRIVAEEHPLAFVFKVYSDKELVYVSN